MSFLIPLVVMGALAGVVVSGQMPNPPAAAPKAAQPVSHVPFDADADRVGVGAYLKGAVAELDGNPDIALQGYLQALSGDPDNMALRQRSLELAMMAGDIPNAIRLARSLPEIEQTTLSRLVKMADAAHEGRLDDARKIARDVSKVSPELLQFRLLKVYLDYGHGQDVAKLIAWLDSDGLPASMSGRRDYHAARLWLKAGEPAKALEALQRAAAAEPGSAATTLLLGHVLAWQGLPGEGAAVYDSFRANTPSLAFLVPPGADLLRQQPAPFASTPDDDMASVMSDFGLLVWSQGAYGPARQILNLSLWLNPNDAATRYYSGMLLEMGGDLEAAHNHYAAIDRIAPTDGMRVAARIRMAEIAFLQGDHDTPWKSLRTLLKAHPHDANLLRSLAQMAHSREDYTQSAAYYGRLLATLPETAGAPARVDILFARGVAYERAGKLDKAADDMLAALEIDPAQAQILNYLGYMWVDNGTNLDEAFRLLQQAHTLAPDDGAITDSMGWAYYKKGDMTKALAYLQRATEQDPESPEIYDHLGDAYARAGQIDEARREWRRALDLLAAGKEGPDDGFERRVRRKLN